MTLQEAMAELETLGNEKVRALNCRNGADENQFGVKSGDLRMIAKKIKNDPELARQLWQTGNFDARMLATLIAKPAALSYGELETMLQEITASQLADWVMGHWVKLHPQRDEWREKWLASDHPMLLRAGWSLTTQRVINAPQGLDLAALLTRIETEMATAHPLSQWTMNYCLAEIGINHAEYRDRAVQIGEKLGVYRDYPVSKGCTSPFAPIWIDAMVARQK